MRHLLATSIIPPASVTWPIITEWVSPKCHKNWIGKATNLGMTNVTAGAWTGGKPAANMSWYEAAAFVNWLNTSTGHHVAYDLAWTGSAWTMNLWSAAEAWDKEPGPTTNLDLFRHKDAQIGRAHV